MKARWPLIAVFIAALVVIILLILRWAYYVVITLIVGALLMSYRELWSLLRRRKLPPIDERVRGNTGKSLRNGFIFFAVALAVLMLPFSTVITGGNSTVHVLGGLLLSGAAVYMLSYLFYDRVEPSLGERGLKMLRIFLLVAGVSLAAAIVSIFLHNAIYGLFIHWFGADFWDRAGLRDEPLFFFVALLSAVAFVVGIIGSLVLFLKGLFRRVA